MPFHLNLIFLRAPPLLLSLEKPPLVHQPTRALGELGSQRGQLRLVPMEDELLVDIRIHLPE